MLNARDQEMVAKSSQTANLLVQDLRELVQSDDPLLSDVALDILQEAVKVESRLKRIESLARTGKKPA
jgi:hypothetical protein